MRIIILVVGLALTVPSCNTSKILKDAKPYEQFRGFIPVDPYDFSGRVPIYNKGGKNWITYDLLITLSKDQILSALTNETVLLSIGEYNSEGELGFKQAALSIKGHTYKITMDYMKFTTMADTSKGKNDMLRVGVGLRLICNILSLESGVNLGDLFSIGLAAQSKKVSGNMIVEIIGIKSNDVTTLIPLPSEINQSTIQGAMQSLAAIKSKIYDSSTVLFPQVVAVRRL